MKTQLLILASLFTLVPLAGCGTITGGSTRSVNLISQPEGADVIVTNSAGNMVFNGKTPATAVLKPGAGYFRPAKYTVTFTKPGCPPVEKQIKTGINGWYLAGNFFFGGLIGYLVVDPLTGAMWTLERNCSAELTPSSTSSATDVGSLNVVCLNDLPDHLRSHLRRVN